MKRIVFFLMAMLMIALPSSAQNYKNSQYYNQKTGHLDYHFNSYLGEAYLGMRLGPAFTYVTSDDARLDGGNWQTGLNVGVVGGFALSESTPVFMETGLYYIEKGGKKNLEGGKKMTYDLNYLEIPVLVKYKYEVDDEFTVEPFAGGYFAMGVGGKIKNFAEREAQSSFRSNNFRRFDGGLRIGCGLGYDMFYADLSYDLGLANICHDDFDKARNRALIFNFGVNF